MNLTDFIEIGMLHKPNGFEGKLELKLDYTLKEGSTLASFFVEDVPIPLPYFIDFLKETSTKGSFLLQLEDVVNLEQAKKLKSKKVYFPKSDLEKYFEVETKSLFSSNQLMGLKLLDEKGNLLGIIEDIFDNNFQQRLLQVFVNKKEVLIPFVEDQVIEINEKSAFLKYQIPDGLLDIYLES